MGGLLGLLFLTEIFLIVDNDLIPWIGRADLEGWIELSPLNWTLWSHLIDVVTPRSSWTFNLYFLLLFFLLASLILLVAMIGAIVLTLHRVSISSEKMCFNKTVENLLRLSGSLNKK
jgi:NADH-ubiquinone oxidoreductase chain 6